MGFWSFMGRRFSLYGGAYEPIHVVRDPGKARRYVNTATREGQSEAYNVSTVVRSAINTRVTAFSNLEVWALNERNRVLMNPTVREDLDKIYGWYNEFQDFKRFGQYAMNHLMVYGKVYVWRYKVYGGGYYHYVIPNLFIREKYKDSPGVNRMFNREVDHYEVVVPGQRTGLRLRRDEVIVHYDNHLSMGDPGGDLASRLVPLDTVISTLATIEGTRHQLTADAGARGLISLGARDVDTISSPFLSSEREELQEELKKYGSLRDQFKYIVTKGAASYTPMTSRVPDLELPKSFLDSKLEVYAAYGIPAAYTEQETRYRALPEAKLMFYEDTVVPEGKGFLAFLVSLKEIPDRPWRYEPDWSHLSIYQDALSRKGSMIQQAAQGVAGLVNNGVWSPETGRDVMDYFVPEYITR